MTLTPEQIVENFDKYRSFMEKLGDRSEQALALVDYMGERLAMCPASGRKDFHSAHLGGLVDHSLRVLANALRLDKTFNWNLSKESIIVAACFHDLGKCGDLVNDYFIPQESEWHKEKIGEMFKHNPAILYMQVPDRSLWLCQQFGLKLSQDEWLSIKLHDGQFAEANAPYKMKEPQLADAIHLADLISTKQEKILFGGA